MSVDSGGKSPSVRYCDRVGLGGSNELAVKFYHSDAFGFWAGPQSGITAVDIDSGDEDLLRDVLKRHGHTPIVVRTGSGNFHLWYRSNKEPRRVRPDADVPVDILGLGAVVAPPSLGGCEPYEWLRGSLDDVRRLPVARNIEGSQPRLLSSRRVPAGQRNNALFRHLMREAPHVDDEETLLDVARTLVAECFDPPLPDAEIAKVVRSVWGYEIRGQNRFGAPPTVQLDRATVDEHARKSPYAIALLLELKSNHDGLREEFAVANSMATSMGWSLPRFRAARSYLLEHGLLTCVHPGGRGPRDPARYRF